MRCFMLVQVDLVQLVETPTRLHDKRRSKHEIEHRFEDQAATNIVETALCQMKATLQGMALAMPCFNPKVCWRVRGNRGTG